MVGTRDAKTEEEEGKAFTHQGITAKPSIPFWTILPLDVVHEVLRWLQPIDLLQLARSTKTLRSHLMSKVSFSVWKASRENVIGGTPECPEYMSEPAFARLLFANECFACGKPGNNAQCPIYWTIQMRCCPKCVFDSFVARTYVEEYIPEIENTVLVVELLPSAYMKRHRRRARRYYVPAIREMAAAIEDHENLILARVSGAEGAFKEFKNTQRTKMAAMEKDVRVFATWYIEHERLVHERNRELEKQREQSFTAKLLAEGYHPDDVAATYGPFNSTEPLTDEVWTAIRPRRERESLLGRRRVVAINILWGHPVSTYINRDIFSPSLEEVVHGFEPITLVVEREGDEEATEEDFEGVLEGVEEWIKEQRTERERGTMGFSGGINDSNVNE
ncbi:hypothetical protein FRB93_006749 [Tulasnella sp. JGI-2019a]|nr:hypothetical protein FRB93_006749 [Tulasnella sp. JGI-2019a]